MDKTDNIPYVPSWILLSEMQLRLELMAQTYPDYNLKIEKKNTFENDGNKIQTCLFFDGVEVTYPLSENQHQEEYTIAIAIGSVGNNTDDVVEKILNIAEYIKIFILSTDFKSSKFEIKLPNSEVKKPIKSNYRTSYRLTEIVPINGDINDTTSDKIFGMVLKFKTTIITSHIDLIEHKTPLTFGKIALEKEKQ